MMSNPSLCSSVMRTPWGTKTGGPEFDQEIPSKRPLSTIITADRPESVRDHILSFARQVHTQWIYITPSSTDSLKISDYLNKEVGLNKLMGHLEKMVAITPEQHKFIEDALKKLREMQKNIKDMSVEAFFNAIDDANKIVQQFNPAKLIDTERAYYEEARSHADKFHEFVYDKMETTFSFTPYYQVFTKAFQDILKHKEAIKGIVEKQRAFETTRPTKETLQEELNALVKLRELDHFYLFSNFYFEKSAEFSKLLSA